ncbi:LamG-like jellyroll fold domain-containing protein [Haloarcula sp. GH36]|uniref:LamG-like jellyroll fold domain-containing protein n=1 Tax=Haloarcula montana TaxID=3111776 RepID=UPI002D775255|nr:LamG-like jellyroll fold domain-containing protein [Haloarcula sp. GH36]
MNDVNEATATLLEEKPHLRSHLEDLLSHDKRGTWEFDDIELDSGEFGELVSRGIVEEHEGGYRLVDRNAVEMALFGEASHSSTSRVDGQQLSAAVPDIDYRRQGPLVALLAGVALIRTVFNFGAVFRSDHITLTGNDPYFYWYSVNRLSRSSLQAFSLEALTKLPEGIHNHDVLTTVSLWWATVLFGGSPRTGGIVLAVYPVVSGVITAALIYWFAIRLLNDHRMGLASVALLAVVPAHAYRTSIGFADHDAFDFLWLALTAFALLVVLQSRDRDGTSREAITGMCIVGVGVVAQVMSWRAGPLLVAPVGIFLFFSTFKSVQREKSPLEDTRGVLLGLGVAAALGLVTHFVFGWMPLYRAASPLFLLVGSLSVVGLGEAAYRVGRSQRVFVLTSVTVSGFFAMFLAWILPGFSGALERFVGYMIQFQSSGIAETMGLFSGSLGIVFAPVLIFGFVLFLGLPYLIIGTHHAYRQDNLGWLLLSVYGWSFFLLSLVQIRFGGYLALFITVPAGIGFVHIAARTDVLQEFEFFSAGRKFSRPTLPSSRTLGYLLLLFMLIGGIGGLQSAVKMNQLAVGEEQYETAVGINNYEEAREFSYPENYVLSDWGVNRFYNYLVNGESRTYGYAKNNYEEFITATNGESAYNKYKERVGFVVINEGLDRLGEQTLQSKLRTYPEGGGSGQSSVSNYRLIINGDGLRVFALVGGGTITGQAPPNSSVVVQQNVTVGETSFNYRRSVQATMNGWYVVTVPYPGQYTILNDTETVTEHDIRDPGFITNGQGRAYWTFNEGRGEVAFDAVGGNHARVNGTSWTTNPKNRAVHFDGSGSIVVKNASQLWNEQFILTVRFKTDPDVNYSSAVRFPRLVSTSPETPFRRTDGYMLALSSGNVVAAAGNGSEAAVVNGPTVTDGEWHRLTFMRNGSRYRLYLDGQFVGEESFDGDIQNSEAFRIGATSQGERGFVGTIDEARFNTSVADP